MATLPIDLESDLSVIRSGGGEKRASCIYAFSFSQRDSEGIQETCCSFATKAKLRLNDLTMETCAIGRRSSISLDLGFITPNCFVL